MVVGRQRALVPGFVAVLAFLLVASCHHEGDVAPPVPAPVIGDLDATALGTSEASAAASVTDDASATSSGAPDASPPPAVSPPDMSSAPAYPASALYDTFSNAKQKLIACYLPGKKNDPKLRGKVIVKFTINSDGHAKPVTNEGSTLQDDAVIACVIRTLKTLSFTKPVEGSVTVTYPFIFRSTGDETLILPVRPTPPSDAGARSP
jgi:hypothetical protein